MREVMIGANSIVLIRVSQGIFAVDAVCPHLGGLLGDGTLVGGRLVCPDHAAAFDVTTGAVVADPFGVEPPHGAVSSVGTYSTREEAGMVEVDLPGR